MLLALGVTDKQADGCRIPLSCVAGFVEPIHAYVGGSQLGEKAFTFGALKPRGGQRTFNRTAGYFEKDPIFGGDTFDGSALEPLASPLVGGLNPNLSANHTEQEDVWAANRQRADHYVQFGTKRLLHAYRKFLVRLAPTDVYMYMCRHTASCSFRFVLACPAVLVACL